MKVQAAAAGDFDIIHSRVGGGVQRPQAHGGSVGRRTILHHVIAMNDRGRTVTFVGVARGSGGRFGSIQSGAEQRCDQPAGGIEPWLARRSVNFHQAAGVRPRTTSNLAASSPMRELGMVEKSIVTEARAFSSRMPR